MPFSSHMKINSASILRNTISETESVAGVLNAVILIITEILVFLGISFVLILYQPIGSIIIIFYVFIAALSFHLLIRKRMLNWGKLRQFHEGKRIQKINEGIRGIIEVKLAKNFNFFFNTFNHHNEMTNIVHKKRRIVSMLPKIWLEFVIVVALLSLALTFFLLDKNFKEILPIIGLFAAAAFRVIPSMQRILTSYQAVRFLIPAINKVYYELESFKLNYVQKNNQTYIFDKTIKFKNKDFIFKSKKNIKIFENLNIDINKGDFIGIIGKSGTGKTTFLISYLV